MCFGCFAFLHCNNRRSLLPLDCGGFYYAGVCIVEEIEYKRCSICGELFPNTNEYFYYAKKADGILSNHCKKCDNACKKRWREKVKSDGGERLEKMCEQRRKYYQTHKEQHAEWAKEYAKKHTEQYKQLLIFYSFISHRQGDKHVFSFTIGKVKWRSNAWLQKPNTENTYCTGL